MPATGRCSSADCSAKSTALQRPRRSRRINATTGAVVTTFKSPNPSGQVTDIQLSGGKLYIGGVVHAPSAASPVPVWRRSTPPPARTRDRWRSRSPTPGVAEQSGSNTSTSAMTAPRWSRSATSAPSTAKAARRSRWWISPAPPRRSAVGPPRDTRDNCASVFDTYMRDVDIASTNDYFVVVSTGAHAGGVNSGTLCDTAARWELGPTTAGQNPTWADYTGGDTLTEVEITGPVVYVGGHMRWMNNPYNADSAGQGAVEREGLAALDPRNGLPLTWNPGRARGVGVWDFMATSSGLWVGHDTNRVAWEERKRIAMFPVAGGTQLPAENTGTLPGHVYLLDPAGPVDDTVSDRVFDGTTVASSSIVGNGAQDWSSSRGAFMVNGTLYTGWADGTLKTRSYNGTTFGASSDIDLNGLTSFANELSNVTAMFYDKVTGRALLHPAGTVVAVLPLLHPAEPNRRCGAVHGPRQCSRSQLERDLWLSSWMAPPCMSGPTRRAISAGSRGTRAATSQGHSPT